jgi:hypothetical protein
MSDWIHMLPVGWMALVIFGTTYAIAAAIWLSVTRLATGDRGRAFKAVSPGMLPPLGIIFGLLVAFLAAQVWGDLDRASGAVNHEASALRAVVLLTAAFPGQPGAQLRDLVAQHIHDAQAVEWPAMARKQASLTMIPAPLARALALTLALPTTDPGKAAAQREIVSALENALDARRLRILVSQSEVNPVKWMALMVQAICTVIAIAMVHSDSRAAAGIATGLFATAVAVCILLLIAHDRPFTGQLGIRPAVLTQVAPQAP